MNRKQYMKTLAARLRFRLPEEEIWEILEEIAERFDEGAGEGISEESICSSLGSPEAAAAEFLQGARDCEGCDKIDILHEILPPAVSLLLTGLLVWTEGNGGGAVFLLPLVPWAIWLICERADCIKSLYSYPADGLMGLSALLLTGAGISCVMLIREALRSPDSLDFLYMCLTAVFILGAMALWAASIRRRGGKRSLLLPLWGAAAAIWATAVSADFFDAYAVYPINGYYGMAGEYCSNFLKLTTALSAVCIFWSIIRRDGFTLPVLALLTGTAMSLLNVYTYLGSVDPLDVNSPALSVGNYSGFILGAASGALWLAFTVVIRAKKRRAAAWKRVR